MRGWVISGGWGRICEHWLWGKCIRMKGSKASSPSADTCGQNCSTEKPGEWNMSFWCQKGEWSLIHIEDTLQISTKLEWLGFHHMPAVCPWITSFNHYNNPKRHIPFLFYRWEKANIAGKISTLKAHWNISEISSILGFKLSSISASTR